jgi:GNAT superfamily N-acetyltransferase
MNGGGLKTMYEIEEISWKEIKKVWEQHLWPEKKGGVKPTNNWKLTLTPYSFTTIIKEGENPIKTNPYFFGIRVGGELVCVNSCFMTSSSHPFSYKEDSYWRSRGLWTSPNHRRKGLSFKILTHTAEFVSKHDATWLWTVPRESALPAYEKVGFVKKSDWFDDGQYGPNCIASKYL